MAEKVPIFVVLGLDIDRKPHASRFAEPDAPLLQRASELMGFHNQATYIRQLKRMMKSLREELTLHPRAE